MRKWLWMAAGAAALLASACGALSPEAELLADDLPVWAQVPHQDPVESSPEPPEVPTPTVEAEPEPVALSSLAELITPVGSALYDPADHEPPVTPVSLSIDAIRVDNAPVRAVGVRDDGEFEVPPASEVGWYRFGPSPGDQGSAVLAAHIAFNGEDGVFRNLDEIDIGTTIEVGYADGSDATFEVVSTDQYDKTELPFDTIFTSTGDPVLTLITCGGDFNPSVGSYEDNVVAYAVPITS